MTAEHLFRLFSAKGTLWINPAGRLTPCTAGAEWAAAASTALGRGRRSSRLWAEGALMHLSRLKRRPPLGKLELRGAAERSLVRETRAFALTALGVWLPEPNASRREGGQERRHVWLSGRLRPGERAAVRSADLATYLRALGQRDAAARCNPRKQSKQAGGCPELGPEVAPPCVFAEAPVARRLGARPC
jgi:hypothetical protein